MLGEPDADYISANYIDVSAWPRSFCLSVPVPTRLGRAETYQRINEDLNG